METNAIFPPHGSAKQIKVVVYGSAFLHVNSKDEFLSTLVDHEYQHVRLLTNQVALAIPERLIVELSNRALDANGDLYSIFSELHAYISQINLYSSRNLSEAFKKEQIAEYNLYRGLLEAKERTPLTTYLLDIFPKINS